MGKSPTALLAFVMFFFLADVTVNFLSLDLYLK